MSTHEGILLYGAYGYTGELIARRWASRGRRPLLAGRDRTRLQALGDSLDLPTRVLPLERDALRRALQDVTVVLHCAGPFSATAAPMLRAALDTRTHYLDITGEVAVFTQAQQLASEARAADVVLCPGVGFDVVPTDCIAVTLARAMPEATHLALAFDSRSSLSPGTTKTSIEGMAGGGQARVNGALVPIPLASKSRRIDFGNGEKLAMAITWGDLVTAGHSTGIPNIDVYVPISPGALRRLRQLTALRPLLQVPGAVWLAKALAGAQVRGPDAQERDRHGTRLWGEVVDERSGARKVARLQTANGYEVTVEAAIAIAERVRDSAPSGNYYTPAQLMGADFVSTLPGSSEISLGEA